VNYQLLVWRLVKWCKPSRDRPQSELWSKTRELTLGDVSGPARLCVVELGLDQNLMGWRSTAPSVLLGDREPIFAKRCERGARRFQVLNWTTRRILHNFGWRFWCDALLGAQLRLQLVLGYHMATRGYSLVVLEVKWSVWDRGSYGWVPEDCPPRCYPMSLVVLGQIRLRFILGNSTWCYRLWLWQIYSRMWTIRWWPMVGGASRHSWQQRSINVIIKGWRIKRRLEEDLEVRIKGYGLWVLRKATLLLGFGEQVRVVLLPGFCEQTMVVACKS